MKSHFQLYWLQRDKEIGVLFCVQKELEKDCIGLHLYLWDLVIHLGVFK